MNAIRTCISLLLMAFLIYFLHVAFPFISLPAIPGYSWARQPFGYALYNETTHERSLSLMVTGFGEPAQVCDFEHLTKECQYFKTNSDATAEIAKAFKDHR